MNKQAQAEEPVDLTITQIKRDEVKTMMGEINDVVGEIDSLFSSTNQKSMMELRANRTPKYANQKETKAEEAEAFSVATGVVPDWAITKMGAENQVHIEASDKITEGYNEIELENAESCITLQPSAKNNFMVESSEQKEREMTVEDIYNHEDDEEYNMDVDENEYYNLKSTTSENIVRNSFIYDREIPQSNNQSTGKFFEDEVEEELKNEYKSTPTNYDAGYRENKISNFKEKRDQEKTQKTEQTQEILDESQDASSIEIENILMKNKINEPKIPLNPAPKRQEWNKNPKKAYNKIGSHMVVERNYFEDENKYDEIQEGIISAEDMPKGMMDDLDLIAQTPKPNLKYPVPSRENEFGEASFGNQSKQFNSMRSKNASQSPTPYPQSYDNDSSSKGSFKYDQANILINNDPVDRKQDSDSKQNLKSRIPSIKKTDSGKEKKLLDSKKHIRSFVEEHAEELEELPIPYSKVDDKSENNETIPNKLNNINTLGIPIQKARNENISTANNYNISNEPGDKSDTSSGQDDAYQKEESVRFEDARGENHRYYDAQSYGDSVLVGTVEDSNTARSADIVTTAAVNSSINSEINKINQALLNINLLMNQKDSKDVSLLPDVANNLNKSLNLWNSMMISFNWNAENQSTLQKSLQDSHWFNNSFSLQTSKNSEEVLIESLSDRLLKTVLKKLDQTK